MYYKVVNQNEAIQVIFLQAAPMTIMMIATEKTIIRKEA
jgi:hypothetical protein